jgi:hypothetical protein
MRIRHKITLCLQCLPPPEARVSLFGTSGKVSPCADITITKYLSLFTNLYTLKNICIKQLLLSLPTSYRCHTGGRSGRRYRPFKLRPIIGHEGPEGE